MQAKVSDPQDRQNVIAYLKSISGNGAIPDNSHADH
jgi:cytochrome c2